jgi:acetylornithine deacetylase/succinyl-diaminopimelate desuccinylase-like protein
MIDKRHKAINDAIKYYDDGNFLIDLNRLISKKTTSQVEGSKNFLKEYLSELIGIELEQLGFKINIYENPEPEAGPIMLANRHEDENKPTILIYAHGDTVIGQDEKWDKGLSPWKLTEDGERLYGRGTADNKGQHWINISGLKTVLKNRGKLGFNCKILIESDEEMGSRGLRIFCNEKKNLLSSDLLIASDGPRLNPDSATVVLGSRGLVNFELLVNLREEYHHSGNWGGLIKDPGIILAHAISSITDKRGQICIPDWRPTSLTNEIKYLLSKLSVSGGTKAPNIDIDWGEITLSPEERVFGWNSFSVLSLEQGDPEQPQNAISPYSRAICQLRYVVGTNPEEIIPALRRHLDKEGFNNVNIQPTRMSGMKATRSDPSNKWVKLALGSINKTLGHPASLLPNIGGSIPNDIFAEYYFLNSIS